MGGTTGCGPELDELLAIAVEVAREAAGTAFAARAAGLSRGDVSSKSTATDLVTSADRAVERLIADLLRRRRPGDELFGEEYGAHGTAGAGGAEGASAEDGGAEGRSTGSAQAAPRVRWVVDPIDGTVNFVYGLPQYAVSVAAEVDGVASVGVVRNAVTGEEWTATRGGGAWRGGEQISCSTVTELDQALIATGFGYSAERRAHQAGVLARLLPLVRDIRRFGAASLDLCFAAEGRVDAYFEKGLGPWDHAAGGLIATEAGLRVSGLRGAPPGPRMVLAAPPGLYRSLHDLLAGLDADGGA
jgi:myo-inositol-1(or 4)-monophosphatase